MLGAQPTLSASFLYFSDDTRHSSVGATTPGVHVESPVRGALYGSHLDIHVVGRVSAGGETLTEYAGAPENYPENLSNSSALSSVVQVSWRRHWAIVDAQPLSAAQSRAPPLESQECAEDSFPPLLPRLIVRRKGFPYFDVLCGLFVLFFVFTEADTFFFTFDFWEIIGFSLFEAFEGICVCMFNPHPRILFH